MLQNSFLQNKSSRLVLTDDTWILITPNLYVNPYRITLTFSESDVFITGNTSYTFLGSKAEPALKSSLCFFKGTFGLIGSNSLKNEILKYIQHIKKLKSRTIWCVCVCVCVCVCASIYACQTSVTSMRVQNWSEQSSI